MVAKKLGHRVAHGLLGVMIQPGLHQPVQLGRDTIRQFQLQRLHGVSVSCGLRGIKGRYRSPSLRFPVRLLIDTGAIYSVLDRGQTRRLNLRTIDTQTRIVGVGRIGSAPLHAATLSSLELGEFTLRNIMVGVTDLSSWGIGGRAKSVTDLQGILGADQLFLNGALIDYPGYKLWLRPAQPSPATE
jgi:hypothetical protein